MKPGKLALHWERTGKIERPPDSAPVSASAELLPPAAPTIVMAVDSYMRDVTDRNNKESTLSKKKTIFVTGPQSLLAFARHKGLRFLSELTIAMLREWQSSWKVASLTRDKPQKQVIGFLWFCERSDWYPRNHATNMTAALGKSMFSALRRDISCRPSTSRSWMSRGFTATAHRLINIIRPRSAATASAP